MLEFLAATYFCHTSCTVNQEGAETSSSSRRIKPGVLRGIERAEAGLQTLSKEIRGP